MHVLFPIAPLIKHHVTFAIGRKRRRERAYGGVVPINNLARGGFEGSARALNVVVSLFAS